MSHMPCQRPCSIPLARVYSSWVWYLLRVCQAKRHDSSLGNNMNQSLFKDISRPLKCIPLPYLCLEFLPRETGQRHVVCKCVPRVTFSSRFRPFFARYFLFCALESDQLSFLESPLIYQYEIISVPSSAPLCTQPSIILISMLATTQACPANFIVSQVSVFYYTTHQVNSCFRRREPKGVDFTPLADL